MRKLLITLVVLLLLTNVVVLAGVAYNRSGEPLASVELTERELPIQRSYRSNDENSGTALRLGWQVLVPDKLEYRSSRYGTPEWLDEDKLTALGFDIETFKKDIAKYQYRTGHLDTEVILVMEYEGDTYHRALALMASKVEELRKRAVDSPDDKKLSKKLERFETQLRQEKLTNTRLYVIDAGLDEQTLMQQYANKSNLLFMRGKIGLRWRKEAIQGRIKQVHANLVHVPLPFSEQLPVLTAGKTFSTYGKNPTPPRYKVRLNIGKRFEPWIDSVMAMEK